MDPLTEPAGGNLTTARLVLRSWERRGRRGTVRALHRPRGHAALSRPGHARADRRDGRAAPAAPRRRPARALRRTAVEASGTFIGFVGLAEPRFEAPFTPCVEIGWRLRRDAWGHGYATEAAEAVLAHGFETLRLPEIVSFTTVANEPSRAVMRRLGMHHDPAEDFDHPSVPEGHPVRRHVLYRLTAEEWRARRPAAH